MATLTNKIIQYIGAEVDFINDVKLQNDGQGDYIKEWNLDITSTYTSTTRRIRNTS
jgi:hypothetical protein